MGVYSARKREASALRPAARTAGARLHAQQHAARLKRRARPKASIVTGYRTFDDSTFHKRRGRKMGGLGRHYSTTERHAVTGPNLV